MNPELKGMWADSLDCTLEDFNPEVSDNFFILMNLKIGPVHENCADIFELKVCTPGWLSENQWCPEVLRHMLLVRRYDYDQIVDVVKQYIEKCNGIDWSDVSLKLSRYFDWEYEDYRD